MPRVFAMAATTLCRPTNCPFVTPREWKTRSDQIRGHRSVGWADSLEAFLHGVVLFPAFSWGIALQEFVGSFVVGDLSLFSVELQGAAETLSDAAEHKDLRQRTRYSEF